MKPSVKHILPSAFLLVDFSIKNLRFLFDFRHTYGVLVFFISGFSFFSWVEFLMDVLTFLAFLEKCPEGGHILFQNLKKWHMVLQYFLQTSLSSIKTNTKRPLTETTRNFSLDRSGERLIDRAIDRSSDRASKRPSDRSSGRANDRGSEPSSKRTMERTIT